jgi:acetolactate synthase-1/2/3 large subunit
MKASDYIAEYLKANGIRSVYGYIGGAITHIIDSLGNAGVEFVNFNHEQGAIFAASGASKADNRLRVVVATSGPGATNFITGIAEAYFDSVPILVITGQVNTYEFKWEKKCRQLGFQETDIVSIVKPITKYSSFISVAETIPEELERAVKAALLGRPGPVLLDIPLDLQRADIAVPPIKRPDLPILSSDRAAVTATIKDLALASRPIVLVGNGCKIRGSKELLVHVLERLRVPVVVSLLGKGAFPEDNELFLGFVGSYGNRYANIALAHADTVLVLGARLDSRQTGNVLAPFNNKKIIQVDVDPEELQTRLHVARPINAEVVDFLEKMKNELDKNEFTKDHRAWQTALSGLKEAFSPLSEIERANENPFEYIFTREISSLMGPNDAVVVDIGQVQMIAAQIMKVQDDQLFITSGGMAPMGYALPAAIGIALETGRKVVSINGDGGMQINIQEMNLLARKKAKVLLVVLDNLSLGMIKQFQELYFESRYYGTDESHNYYSCNFAKISEAYGVPAMTIRSTDKDWKEKLDVAFTMPWPLLLHVVLDYGTKVYPKLRFDRGLADPEPVLSQGDEHIISHLLGHLT